MKESCFKGCFCSKAFTLIELLVVVLIIGILAAVAVPQYQRVIQKAQFSKLRVLADSLVKTVQVAYLSKGSWPQSFEELDVSLPADMFSIVERTEEYASCASNNEMYCCIVWPRVDWNNGFIVCGKDDYSFAYLHVYANQTGTPIDISMCDELSEDVFCRTLPGAVKNKNKALITPEGWKAITAGYNID